MSPFDLAFPETREPPAGAGPAARDGAISAPESLGFGRVLAPWVIALDHDQARAGNGGWSSIRVLPRAAAHLPVATGALQYALSVFEGLKAYRGPDGATPDDVHAEAAGAGHRGVHLFRPLEHVRRLNRSAARLNLPVIDEELLQSALRSAVRVNELMLPPHRRGSLYLRPTLYATEEGLGLRPARTHRLVIVASACGPVATTPRRLWAEGAMIRAAAGGLGAAKTGANYAASLLGARLARERGYDDALWLDAETRRHLGEAGTMNVFVVLRDRVLTPPLDGSILAGITRDCVLRLLAEAGVAVHEQPIALDELQSWQRSGELREIFGCGTAVRLAPIESIDWEQDGARHVVRAAGGALVDRLAARLADLQDGVAADVHGWRGEVG